ncbi:MAG: ABC transporter permease subunit [Candidatus Schekmanbacteria bacterium]|nr:ABC transporter permease subunit [Candidatus Schekmanbacteria bacterium]
MLLLLLTVVVVGADRLSFRTYSAADTYLQALAVGAANTLKVSVLGCLGATVLGGAIGISRLSSNWLLARLAAAYVEIVRNVPLLVQLSFWYFAVLGALPGPRDSIALGLATLNNRGLYLPWPVLAPPWRSHVVALVAGVALASLWRFRRLRAHSRLPPLAGGGPGWGGGRLVGPLLAVGPSAVTLALTGTPLYFDYPVLAGFNFRGGVALTPELTALLGGLILYTAAFVAEIVRSGILAVPAGQREAALALGLSRGRTLHLVLLPQALRVMIPPLTNQYLNLTKNSSLGVAIAYPEIVSVGGTVLNQSGQAIETIGIMMAVYLGLSLSISAYMSWHHAQGQRAER